MNIKVRRFNVLKVLILLFLLVFIIYILHTSIFTIPVEAVSLSQKCKNNTKSISTELDNYSIDICTPFFPNNNFWKDDIDAKSDSVRAQSWSPFKEFLIKYFDKNEGADSEGILKEDTKDLQSLTKKVLDKRNIEDKSILKNLNITISNNKVRGFASIVERNIDSLENKPVLIIEFYTDFDDKSWLVRMSQEIDTKSIDKQKIDLIKKLSDVNIDISKKPLIKSIIDVPENKLGAIVPDNIKNPDWWQGYDTNNPYDTNFRDSCDVQKFPGSIKMSGSSLGEARVGNVTACGPKDKFWGPINYSAGSQGSGVGEYMWQCVEYSMRWMRLAYNESPYLLSGQGEARKIMLEYPQGAAGRHLVKVANGTPMQGPTPGDVLAKGVTGDGHTLVVKESHLNSDGTGYVIAVDQNSDTVGIRRIDMVSAWHLQDMNGWLHDPAAGTGVTSCNIPASGDWTISGNVSCAINNNQSFSGNIFINDTSSLSINSGGNLDLDLKNKKIVIRSTAKLLVKSGGKLY